MKCFNKKRNVKMIKNEYLTNLLKNLIDNRKELSICIGSIDILKEKISISAKKDLEDSIINIIMEDLELCIDDLEY